MCLIAGICNVYNFTYLSVTLTGFTLNFFKFSRGRVLLLTWCCAEREREKEREYTIQGCMCLCVSAVAVLHAGHGVSTRAKSFQTPPESCLCKSADHSQRVRPSTAS